MLIAKDEIFGPVQTILKFKYESNVKPLCLTYSE